MDPNANLKEQLKLARVLADRDASTGDLQDMGIELAELVLALNEWIINGGFLPLDWRKSNG